jgi:hypothetical protein
VGTEQADATLRFVNGGDSKASEGIDDSEVCPLRVVNNYRHEILQVIGCLVRETIRFANLH